LAATPEGSRGIRNVLAEGGRLFGAGLATVFPWVLAAELVQALPFAGDGGNIFTMDLAQLGRADYLARALLTGIAQAVLYSIAILRLAALAREPVQGKSGWNAARAVPAVLVGYLAYEVVVGLGLLLSFAVFMIGLFIAGPLFGLVLCVLPLVPTAAVSTALALFIFPAVLERCGPFASLGKSSRLAKSHWATVTLVISVPALALLAAWCVQNGPEVARMAHSYLDLMAQHAEDGLSIGDLEQLQAGLDKQPQGGTDGWKLGGIVLGAFAWWYTLAVCYAQYRDLKRT
jgi:hypothetical protein